MELSACSSAVTEADSEVEEVCLCSLSRSGNETCDSLEELGSSKVKVLLWLLGLTTGGVLVGDFLLFTLDERDDLRSPRSRSTPRRTDLRKEPVRLRVCLSDESYVTSSMGAYSRPWL